jgi:hypothetical protein
MSNRYTDIIATNEKLTEIYGYKNHPLLPLEKALEPLLPYMQQLDSYIKEAKRYCCHPSEHRLTKDESAAVYLYSIEWGHQSLYRVLNSVLRSKNRSLVNPWLAYLKLFHTAIKKLPTVEDILWRGVPNDISINYKKGQEIVWWSESSCTTSIDVVKDFVGSNSTIFMIKAKNGKNLTGYTKYPYENEVLLPSGTHLRVKSDPLELELGTKIVHLEEVSVTRTSSEYCAVYSTILEYKHPFLRLKMLDFSRRKSLPTVPTMKNSSRNDFGFIHAL